MIRPQGRTAVYRLYAADELLYVGATSNPAARWSAHAWTKPWWPQVSRKTVDWYDTRSEALEAESHAIRAEKPLHNGGGTATRDESSRVSEARGYVPPDDFLTARAEMDAAARHYDELREEFEAMCLDLIRGGVATARVAAHTPWSGEAMRQMARNAEIDPLRKPTVRSIKPKRRTTA